MTDPTLPQDPTESLDAAEAPDEADGGRNTKRVIGALIALAVILAAALVYVLVSDDDDDEVATTDSTTSTTVEETTTSETTESTTTTTSAPADIPADAELDTVVWPGPDTEVRYTTPEAAAEGFAVDLVGFSDPILGEFQQGDTRSGEIEIRSREEGRPTTVLVRQLSDDNWWVLGALTEFIELDEPAAGDTIANPVTLAGRSTAFEATVNVSVFELGGTEPLGEGFVMGGATGDLEPFSGEIAFEPQSGGRGVVVLYTISAMDGSIEEAAAAPVQFG